MNLLTIENLHIIKNKKNLIHIEKLEIKQQQINIIIGPNGAGKTTLLHALAGQHNPSHILHHQTPLSNYNKQQLAEKRALLAQNYHIAFPLSVEALVKLGREPYHKQKTKQHDQEVCTYWLEKLGLLALKKRNCLNLSGGEQHRAHIARVLAQITPEINSNLNNKWLLLDEPSNHLDIHHQYQLYAQLENLKQQGLTIIAIFHDPALALNLADHLILLKNGKLFSCHTPKTLAQSQDLDELYQINMNTSYNHQLKCYQLAPKLNSTTKYPQ